MKAPEKLLNELAADEIVFGKMALSQKGLEILSLAILEERADVVIEVAGSEAKVSDLVDWEKALRLKALAQDYGLLELFEAQSLAQFEGLDELEELLRTKIKPLTPFVPAGAGKSQAPRFSLVDALPVEGLPPLRKPKKTKKKAGKKAVKKPTAPKHKQNGSPGKAKKAPEKKAPEKKAPETKAPEKKTSARKGPKRRKSKARRKR